MGCDYGLQIIFTHFWDMGQMICPAKPMDAFSPEHLVTETLEAIAVKGIKVEWVDPEKEARWNKLIRKRH